MRRIELYATAWCPYCVRAKALLRAKGVAFEEISVEGDPAGWQRMVERSRRETVPQIFIDDHHVGGFDDIAALDAQGRLDPLLGLHGASG